MKFLRSLIAFWGCIISIGALSQPTPGIPWAISQWQRKVWQIEDGLPNNYVTSIAEESSGRLLIGTKNGIVTFDGFTFEPYSEFGDHWIYSLLLDRSGMLWVGTYNQGLYCIRNNHVTKIAAGAFYSLLEDRDGRIWAVSANGLGLIESDRYKIVIPGKDTEGFGWQSAAIADDGRLWFAAQSGIFRYSTNQVQPIAVRHLDGNPVTLYFRRNSHEPLIGTTKGLYRLACKQSSCEASAINGIGGPVVNILQASDQTLWIATWGHGLYRITMVKREMHIENIDHHGELADDFVHALYQDREHNVWLGSRSGGLARFRTTVLKPFGIPEGVNGNCASASVGDGEGGVWLGTWRSGLFHWHNGIVERQALPNGKLYTLINSLQLDSAHNLWIGSFQGLFVLRRGERFVQSITQPLALTGDTDIRQLFFAADRSLWVVKDDGGLLVFPSGDPVTSQRHSVLPEQFITYIFQDSSERIWIGTKSGLWRTTSASVPPTQTHTAASPVLSISEDLKKRLWITFENGKTLVEDQENSASFPTSVFANKLIYKIMQDKEGNFWFSTGLGLVRISKSDIEATLKNPAAPIQAVRFGISDGARTIECRCADYPQSWIAPDGTMWVPTAKGFVQADPRRIKNLPPPHAFIQSIQWNSRPPVSTDNVKLSAGSRNLQINFAAIRLGAPQQVHFRYRLEGLDSNWSDATHNRTVHYPDLGPGTYHFQVAARDAVGTWGSPAEVVIAMQPYFYQTAWFKSLVIFLALLLISTIYFAHLRSVRARYHAVLEERTRIAREWHDTLLSGLSAIAWQFDAAIRMCTQSALLSSLNNVRGMLRYCSDEARRAVSDLRTPTLSPLQLTEMMHNILPQAATGEDPHFELYVDPSLPQLPGELSLHLLRICQEAVTNAIQHGQPSKVIIRLDYSKEVVTLNIHDNGTGMNPLHLQAVDSGHFGLLGMRERVDRIGGKLEILTVQGQGMSVTVKVPISI